MAEKSKFRRSLRLWCLRAVLFVLGFTVTAAVCALYWSLSYVETQDPRCAKPALLCMALLGGVLSAIFGRHYWGSFLSGF